MRSYSTYKMRGDFVQPLSIRAIRNTAIRVRNELKLPLLPSNMWGLLDTLSVRYGINYDIVNDNEMPSFCAEACCIPEQAQIFIPQKAVKAIDAGDRRMMFTIMHELGHFILAHRKSFARSRPKPAVFVDSEWQADQFAAEILMPANVIADEQLYDTEQIKKRFSVSHSAAEERRKRLVNEGLIDTRKEVGYVPRAQKTKPLFMR